MNGGALKDESTVLGEKVVESRGIGTGSSKRDEVHQEIIDFLTGEAKFGLKSETRCFFTILIFLTRLPAPTWVDLHPGYVSAMKGQSNSSSPLTCRLCKLVDERDGVLSTRRNGDRRGSFCGLRFGKKYPWTT